MQGTLFDQLKATVEQERLEDGEVAEAKSRKARGDARVVQGGVSGEGMEADERCLEGWVVRSEEFGEAANRCVAEGIAWRGGEADAVAERELGAGGWKSALLQFDEEGEFLPDVLARFECCKTTFTCVLGDHKGLPDEHMRLLETMEAIKVNLGPRPLLSSQCITIFQHYLDCAVDREGLKQRAP